MNSAQQMRAVIAVSGLLTPATEALALLGDRIELFAAESVTHDDNVFRLSGSVDPVAVLGSSSKGDTFHTTEYGLKLDLPFSLQRFEAGITRRHTRHDRFEALDLSGYENRAIWHWQWGSWASGRLGHTRSRTLASFSSVQAGGAQSITPNFLTTRRSFASAAYRASARWQVGGELERMEQANSATQRQANDITLDSQGLTLSYTTPPGNVAGLSLRFAQGDLPNPLLVGGNPIENSYRQRSVAAFTEWHLSELSLVKAQFGRVWREHRQLPQRDFDGPTFNLSYEWRPSALLHFTVAARQDISPNEEINIGFVRARGIELRAIWQPSEMLGFGARIERSTRRYLGDPVAAAGAAPQRADRLHAMGVMASWRPTRSVTVNLAWQRESRTANVAVGDYRFNAVNLGLRIGF